MVLKRKEQYVLYTQLLENCEVISFQKIRTGTEYNYAYFPIILKTEELLLKVKMLLEANSIFPRRYFFPSLNELPYISTTKKLPNASSISKGVLCLPLYHDLSRTDVQKICNLILDTIKEAE